MDRGAWWATVHRTVKHWTWLSDQHTHTSGSVGFPVAQMVKTLPVMQETQWPLGLEDPMEKGMATQSSILGWRIPWKEEPGGLQFMGSHRIRHDWATSTFTHSDCLGPLSFSSLNQGKVALSCCVSVYRPAVWVRDTHVYVHSFPDSLPTEVLAEHGAESPVLDTVGSHLLHALNGALCIYQSPSPCSSHPASSHLSGEFIAWCVPDPSWLAWPVCEVLGGEGAQTTSPFVL